MYSACVAVILLNYLLELVSVFKLKIKRIDVPEKAENFSGAAPGSCTW